jgi:hypothetical protein
MGKVFCGEIRTWTDVNEKTLQAEFLRQEGTDIYLKLTNQQVAKVPLDRFSQLDQLWLDNQKTNDGKTNESIRVLSPEQKQAQEGSDLQQSELKQTQASVFKNPIAEKIWPQEVKIDGDIKVEVIKEDTEAKEFIYETDHYEFKSQMKLGLSLLRECAKVFEVTYLLNCKIPLNLNPQPEKLRVKFLARIFENEQEYLKNGGVPRTAGIYTPAEKAVMLPIQNLGVRLVGDKAYLDTSNKNFSTLIHEISHQMMNKQNWYLPNWIAEGSATYMEMYKYNHGRFSIVGLKKNIVSMLELYTTHTRGVFEMTSPEKLIFITDEEWDKDLKNPNSVLYPSSMLLFYYFIALDGTGDGKGMSDLFKAINEIQEDSKDINPLINQYVLKYRATDRMKEEVLKTLNKELSIKIQYQY